MQLPTANRRRVTPTRRRPSPPLAGPLRASPAIRKQKRQRRITLGSKAAPAAVAAAAAAPPAALPERSLNNGAAQQPHPEQLLPDQQHQQQAWQQQQPQQLGAADEMLLQLMEQRSQHRHLSRAQLEQIWMDWMFPGCDLALWHICRQRLPGLVLAGLSRLHPLDMWPDNYPHSCPPGVQPLRGLQYPPELQYPVLRPAGAAGDLPPPPPLLAALAPAPQQAQQPQLLPRLVPAAAAPAVGLAAAEQLPEGEDDSTDEEESESAGAAFAVAMQGPAAAAEAAPAGAIHLGSSTCPLLPQSTTSRD